MTTSIQIGIWHERESRDIHQCPRCHAAVCTPGGITSPGHGFGKQGA